MNQVSSSSTMIAARLYAPADIRVERIPHPGPPGPAEVLLRVAAVGICGSDLHTYKGARTGDALLQAPFILGHEFAGVVEEVGSDAFDGCFRSLKPGTRVAVDPAQPCGECEMCEHGHPNLCWRLHFCGLYPDDGSLRQWMRVPSRTCFPVPDGVDTASAALLEPLGTALHAVDLAHVRVDNSVAILGAGPIGLCILQVVKLAGGYPIFVTDKFPWRLEVAGRYGGIPIHCDDEDPVRAVVDSTSGRGVDVAIEAAWSDHSVQQAAEMARSGGRLVVVGIASDDRLVIKHSTARRKGLTIRMARRMKHSFPRATHLVECGLVDLPRLISHRYPLDRAPEAFALNAAYRDRVLKVIIDV